MLKFTVFLCAGLYAAMFFGGVDRGQQRLGLIPALQTKARAAPIAVAEGIEPAAPPVSPQNFAPDAPLMATPVAVVTGPALEPEPRPAPEGLLMQINAKSVNVRSGPGKDYEVVERLGRGESVLVVAQDAGPDGWSLIRIEGDGIEGYVASRLLSE